MLYTSGPILTLSTDVNIWSDIEIKQPTKSFPVNSHLLQGRSPQSCTETDFEMKTSNFVLFSLISVVSVHFRAIYDETILGQT